MYYENDSLPQTLSYFILNKLRWRIITGDLAPGQALREQELESDYGSSRGPVRESLRLALAQRARGAPAAARVPGPERDAGRRP